MAPSHHLWQNGTSEPSSVYKCASSQRWIPPNARERLNTSQQTFRRIRGILNKLTPDNFDRLSRELVHLASSSNDREKLKGSILLVYDKAVDEPSYSCMYAQLCLKLSEFAPNFEDLGSKANTFWKLLLHKCQEEFDNRKRANEVFVGRNELSVEEEEQRALAKHKMLGNIKFVGELFKLGMVHEAIIHSCIKELLEKKKGQSIDDLCQNLECLCHCMTTVGQKLDTEKAKAWMDKYFARIVSLSTNEELPPRIRFMLLNVADLRKGNWSSHHVTASSNKPRPIHEIRQEASQTNSLSSKPPPPLSFGSAAHPPRATFGVPPPGAVGDEGFVTSPLKYSPLSPQDTHTFGPQPPTTQLPQAPVPQKTPTVDVKQQPVQERKHKRLPSSKRDDSVSLRPAFSSLKLGSGSSRHQLSQSSDKGPPAAEGPREATMSHVPRTRDDSSDEEDNVRDSVKGGHVYGEPPFGGIPHPSLFLPSPHYPMGPPPQHFMFPHGPPGLQIGMPPHGKQLGSFGMPMHPPVQRPHFRPLPPHQHQRAPPFGEIPQQFTPYMFPQRFANSAARPVMHQPPLFQKPRPPLRPPASSHNGGVISSDASRGLPPGLDHKEPLPLRYANRSTGGKKSIGKPQIPPDENEKAVESIINKYLRSHNVETAINAVQSLQTISIITVCILLMSKTLEKSEDDRTRMSDLLCELHSQNIISSSDFTKAFDTVMTSSANREADVPQCKTYMAGYAARAIAKGVVTLREVATMFDQGAHHPTMLVILQALLALIGEEKLYNMFTESKLTVTSILPVELQSHESITEITEAKKLGFLYPLKKIQTELDTMLNSGASTSSVYKWIEGNVDSSLHCNPDFIMIITRLILVHATSDTSLARDVNCSLIPSPDIISREKTLVAKYTMLMQRFVSDNIPLQIAVLYTTQMFCDDHNFPKGLVLRLFSYWYEMDVVDGVSLLQWRDDTSQNYPGKGKALFQVNHWLKLVEEAEELSSSDED